MFIQGAFVLGFEVIQALYEPSSNFVMITRARDILGIRMSLAKE
jgi:hypothetical protein